MKKMLPLAVRVNEETKELFSELFAASGANSQGEFLHQLLLESMTPKPIPEKEIEYKEVKIERVLNPNELILSLSQAQLFALSSLILGSPNFAEHQNELIDRLKGGKPWFSGSNLYEPEFKNLWVKNVLISKTMTPEQREKAIKHNMSAYLINMFLVFLIEEQIESPGINVEKLKTFIRSQAAPAKPVEPIKNPNNEPLNN